MDLWYSAQEKGNRSKTGLPLPPQGCHRCLSGVTPRNKAYPTRHFGIVKPSGLWRLFGLMSICLSGRLGKESIPLLDANPLLGVWITKLDGDPQIGSDGFQATVEEAGVAAMLAG